MYEVGQSCNSYVALRYAMNCSLFSKPRRGDFRVHHADTPPMLVGSWPLHPPHVGVVVRERSGLPNGALVFPALEILVGYIVVLHWWWRRGHSTNKVSSSHSSQRDQLQQCRWHIGVDSCWSIWSVRLRFARFVGLIDGDSRGDSPLYSKWSDLWIHMDAPTTFYILHWPLSKNFPRPVSAWTGNGFPSQFGHAASSVSHRCRLRCWCGAFELFLFEVRILDFFFQLWGQKDCNA